MDTDTCDWTARRIVHLQLPLLVYSKNIASVKDMRNRQNRLTELQ